MNATHPLNPADMELAIVTLEAIFRGAAQLARATRANDRQTEAAQATHYLEMTAALMQHTARLAETTTQKDISEQGAAILSNLAEVAALIACGKLCG